MTNKLTICLFGDYDPDYPRQVVIKRGLEKNGVTVLECNCFLKYSQKGVMENKLFYVLGAYSKLLRQFWPIKNQFSIFLVPHNNHLIIPLVWFLSKLYSKKLIMDAFDPAYLSAKVKYLPAWRCFFTKLIENMALKLSDYILVTTSGFKKIYLAAYRLNSKKFIIVPAGANEAKFYPRKKIKRDNMFRIVYWGNFHPHHGVNIIIEAAQSIQNHKEIKFILIGEGRYSSFYQEAAKKLKLNNIKFTGKVSNRALINYIRNADICLGIFSSRKGALASVTNKVFEAMAMGKPVITERNPVTASLFTDREEIWLVPPEDVPALDMAIIELQNNNKLRYKIGQKAVELFQTKFSEKAIGKTFLQSFKGKLTN
jgi:glycosyltransferase involved in cell wall biosynthesis